MHCCMFVASPGPKAGSKWYPQSSGHLKAIVLYISHYHKFGQGWTVGERFDLGHFEDLLLIPLRNKVQQGTKVKPHLSSCSQQVWLLIWCTLPSAHLWRWRPSKPLWCYTPSTRTRSSQSLAPAELLPGSRFLDKDIAWGSLFPCLNGRTFVWKVLGDGLGQHLQGKIRTSILVWWWCGSKLHDFSRLCFSWCFSSTLPWNLLPLFLLLHSIFMSDTGKRHMENLQPFQMSNI